MEDDFNRYIKELEKIYSEDKEKAIKEAKYSLIRLGIKPKEKTTFFKDENSRNLFIRVMLSIAIALLGFIFIGDGLYFGGFIFFIAGHFVGMHVENFGLIFLFSHSCSGIGMMIGPVLSELFRSPYMNDNPRSIYFFLVIGLILLVTATILVILYNLSDKMKAKKNSQIMPLILYFIGFAIMQILGAYPEFIYSLNIF